MFILGLKVALLSVSISSTTNSPDANLFTRPVRVLRRVGERASRPVPNYVESKVLRIGRCLSSFFPVEEPAQKGRLTLLPAVELTSSFIVGGVLFALVTVLTADAPRPLRQVMEGPVRVGPALLDNGVGGALSARW
jgi:hypothetical protein